MMNDLQDAFKIWKETQAEIVRDRKISNKKKEKELKKGKNIKKRSTKKSNKVEALPEKFLEELTAKKSSDSVKRQSFKTKKPRKFSSTLVDNADFIPLETNVTSTDFKVVRLDKNNTSNCFAQEAEDFYKRRLHGKSIKRVPSKSLTAGAQKILAKRSLCVKH